MIFSDSPFPHLQRRNSIFPDRIWEGLNQITCIKPLKQCQQINNYLIVEAIIIGVENQTYMKLVKKGKTGFFFNKKTSDVTFSLWITHFSQALKIYHSGLISEGSQPVSPDQPVIKDMLLPKIETLTKLSFLKRCLRKLPGFYKAAVWFLCPISFASCHLTAQSRNVRLLGRNSQLPHEKKKYMIGIFCCIELVL